MLKVVVTEVVVGARSSNKPTIRRNDIPYIIPAWRKLIDPSIKDIVCELERFEEDTVDGVVNYAFTNILINTYLPDSYLAFERIIGLLECIKLEFYRKAIAVYEDQKAIDNGDVY